MQKLSKVAVAGILFLAVAATAAAQEQKAPPAATPQAGPADTGTPAGPQGDATKGKQLFAADGCYECHDYAGEGSLRTGPAIARTQLPYDAFMAQLRDPANAMPVYTPKVLSNGNAADIYAYLQSLPPSPDAKSIPELQN